jgi:hypothetical protein
VSHVPSTVVGLGNVPEGLRSHSAMDSPDYADLTTVTVGATHKSPEEWARAALEETPTGRSAPRLWRALGLRLGPPNSPGYVQGWKIGDRGDDWIRIEAASSFMTGRAVVQVDDGQVSLALFVRYNQPIAAFVWPPVSVMHRRAMPTLLRQALGARD